MRKFINSPENYVEEIMAGILAAHGDEIACVDGASRLVVKSGNGRGKVALVTGGGSGHLPLFLGYVGEGMLDGCAVGDVFQEPPAADILRVTRAVERGQGVLYLFPEDCPLAENFRQAAKMAEKEGIAVRAVPVADDIGPTLKTDSAQRRAGAGIFYVYKAAGAMANRGKRLGEVLRVAEKARDNTWTLGLVRRACALPGERRPLWEIGDGEVEVGAGIRGEPGVREKWLGADFMVERLTEPLLRLAGAEAGMSFAVMVNGLGATPKEELYILYRHVAEILDKRQTPVWMAHVGEYATSMEATGFSISLLKLDEELKGLLDEGACTPFFRQFAR